MTPSTRIPDDFKQRIREDVSIADLVGRYVKLRKRGSSLLGLCPFHNDKTPSFHARPETNRFKCWGCGKSGDVIDFLMEIEGRGFRDAVEQLAEIAGLELPDETQSEEQRKQAAERRVLLRCMDAAVEWWAGNLTRTVNPGAAELKRRDVSRDAAREWSLGWAPPSGLREHLQRVGFGVGDQVRAGVLVLPEDGGEPYDRFRNRLMFPIRDRRGRVISAGGRLLVGDRGSKYINGPETPIYRKSAALFGLARVLRERSKLERVVVVEGYFDVVVPWSKGVAGHVAPCGTALTEAQIGELRRLDLPVVSLMDGDAAGQAAARKALPLYLRQGVQPLAVALPGGLDPDDLVNEEGPGALVAALSGARPLLDTVLDYHVSRRREDAEGALRDAVAVLEHVSLVTRQAAHQRLARGFDVDIRVVRQAAASAPAEAAQERRQAPEVVPASTTTATPSERRLLALLLQQGPEQWAAGVKALEGLVGDDATRAIALLGEANASGPGALDCDDGLLAREILSSAAEDPTPEHQRPAAILSLMAELRLAALSPLDNDCDDDRGRLRLAVKHAARRHERALLERML